MRKITVELREEGQQLLKLLGRYLQDAPVSFFYKMLRKKNITLNGKKAEGKEKSATYRQLMGNKMQYQNMLSLYEIYGLLEEKSL